MAEDRMAVLDMLRKATADGNVDVLREEVRVLATAIPWGARRLVLPEPARAAAAGRAGPPRGDPGGVRARGVMTSWDTRPCSQAWPRTPKVVGPPPTR